MIFWNSLLLRQWLIDNFNCVIYNNTLEFDCVKKQRLSTFSCWSNNTFSIYEILPQLIELWGLNTATQVEPKKTSPDWPPDDNSTFPIKMQTARSFYDRAVFADDWIDKRYVHWTWKWWVFRVEWGCFSKWYGYVLITSHFPVFFFEQCHTLLHRLWHQLQ